MPKAVIHRTALLLIAMLAMLPLQGIQAALGDLDAHAVHATGHDISAMAEIPDCPMHQTGKGGMPGGKHCSGSCKLCGACAAALLPPLQVRTVALHEQHGPMLTTGYQTRSGAAPFRPPRH